MPQPGHATDQPQRIAARLAAVEHIEENGQFLACRFQTLTGTEFSARIWANSPLWLRWARRLRPGATYDVLLRLRSDRMHDDRVEILTIAPLRSSETQFSSNTPSEALNQLLSLVRAEIASPGIQELVVKLLTENAETLVRLPAARNFHHTAPGGLVVHTLSVTKLAVRLTDELCGLYPPIKTFLNRDLVVAGAALHDLGKTEELLHRDEQDEAAYTRGRLLGHWVTLQDRLTRAAEALRIDPVDVAVLRHIIYAHQTVERGGPANPHCLEAMIVAAADGLDSHIDAALGAIRSYPGEFGFTSPRNPLNRRLLVRRQQPAPASEPGGDNGFQ